jgi:hypothetical protein
VDQQGVTYRLELVLVDRGVTAAAARTLGRDHDIEVRRVGWDDKQPTFRPIRHAWRVEVAPTAASDAPAAWRSRSRTPPPRPPAGSRSPASPLLCGTCHGHEPNGMSGPSRREILTARPQPREVAEVKGAGLTLCQGSRHG